MVAALTDPSGNVVTQPMRPVPVVRRIAVHLPFCQDQAVPMHWEVSMILREGDARAPPHVVDGIFCAVIFTEASRKAHRHGRVVLWNEIEDRTCAAGIIFNSAKSILPTRRISGRYVDLLYRT